MRLLKMKEKINSSIEQSLITSTVYIRWIAIIAIGGILLSGVTFVQSGEAAIVLRFGKLIGDTPAEQVHQPGLHFNLPFIIDKVIRVPVRKVQEVKIDGLYMDDYFEDIAKTGYALTGDENVVLLDAALKYKIIDPVKYVLEVEQPEINLKELATSVLTREIASMCVDDVLVKQKMELSRRVLIDAQKRADQIGLGVQLVAIEFTHIQPPHEVKDEFDLVTGTYVRNETMLQEAGRYKEKVIPEAVAERDSMIQQAKSYKVERIAQAKSDVAQFYGVIGEYRENTDVVHQRLYREKVENIMKKVAGKVFVPKGEGGENIILP
jgi:membrane protease subunit HflK